MADDIESDWQAVKLAEPRKGASESPLESLLEEWDEVQGRDSLFVVLYDDENNEIPGSRKRIDAPFLNGEMGIEWTLAPARSRKIAMLSIWRRHWSTPIEMPMRDGPVEITGSYFAVKIKDHTWHLRIGGQNVVTATSIMTTSISNFSTVTFKIPTTGVLISSGQSIGPTMTFTNY